MKSHCVFVVMKVYINEKKNNEVISVVINNSMTFVHLKIIYDKNLYSYTRDNVLNTVDCNE